MSLERITQNRVVQFFQLLLGYDYLGNWEDRQNNSNVEEELLLRYLQKTYSAELARKASVIDLWYRQQLTTILSSKVPEWEKRLGVKSNGWSLRKMRTKWGSCNTSRKTLHFNPELAKKPVKCIEYIVLHELVHLKERHHNKRFIQLMDKHMPDLEYRREELNLIIS